MNNNRRPPLFQIALWNCFQLTIEGKSKTTNSLEAWHRAMRSNLATENDTQPRFWKWIRGLRKECLVQEAHLMHLQSGGTMKLKRSDKQKAIRHKNIAGVYDRTRMQQYLESHANILTIEDV